MVIYSTITIDRAEFQDTEGVLTPVPAAPLGLAREITPSGEVNPQGIGLTDEGMPATQDPAFVIAIHATDPTVGPPVDDPAIALSTIIGLQVRTPGEYEDFEVPIFPTPQVFPGPGETILQPEQTFPPNPDGDTVVTGTLWRFEYPESEPPFPTPITTADEAPIQTSAIITALDQNRDEPPVNDDGEIVPIEPIDGEPT
jgi:hypothetical protein